MSPKNRERKKSQEEFLMHLQKVSFAGADARRQSTEKSKSYLASN